MLKQVKENMKGLNFEEKAIISFLHYLMAYKDACDMNVIHEGEAIWMLKYTFSGPESQIVDSRLALLGKGNTKERLT